MRESWKRPRIPSSWRRCSCRRSSPSRAAHTRCFRGLPTASTRLRLKLERDAVHAVAFAGGRRSVGEDVAEVPAAIHAVDLGPGHPVAAICCGFDGIGQRRPEAGPACSTLELRRRVEQRLAATCATKRAVAFLFVKRTGAAHLGAVLAQDFVLLRRELGTPLLVVLWGHGPHLTSET